MPNAYSGFPNKGSIEINKNEFIDLKMAKLFLQYMGSVEETYDILISNYIEFEQEILKLTVQNMISINLSHEGFYMIRMLLNKRLINLLTSVRLYQDLVKHQIPENHEQRQELIDQIDIYFSVEFEKNKFYRFMEKLRNYAQHRGLPIHFTRYGTRSIELNENFQLEYSLDFSSYKEKLCLFRSKIGYNF